MGAPGCTAQLHSEVKKCLFLVQVSLVLPSLQAGIGPGFTYLVFAGISVVAVGIIYSLVPETKGKTLEEIESMWNRPQD